MHLPWRGSVERFGAGRVTLRCVSCGWRGWVCLGSHGWGSCERKACLFFWSRVRLGHGSRGWGLGLLFFA